MDAIKGCLEEHTYEDIDLGPTHRTYSREPSRFPSEITQDIESIDTEPLLEVGLYCWLLTAEAYAEMNNNPFHELRDVWIVHLGNHRDPLYQRAATVCSDLSKHILRCGICLASSFFRQTPRKLLD